MRHRLRVLIALLVTSLFVFAGVAVAKPMSAKEFRETANSICAEHSEQLADAASQYFSEGDEPDLPTLKAYVADVEPIVQDQIDAIADLQPPKKLKKKVKKLLATARLELAGLVDDPSILLESNPFADTQTLSSRLGLPQCAN